MGAEHRDTSQKRKSAQKCVFSAHNRHLCTFVHLARSLGIMISRESYRAKAPDCALKDYPAYTQLDVFLVKKTESRFEKLVSLWPPSFLNHDQASTALRVDVTKVLYFFHISCMNTKQWKHHSHQACTHYSHLLSVSFSAFVQSGQSG